MSNKKTVVIVEDDFLIAEYLRDLCDGYGMKVEGSADSAGAAIPMILQKEPAYILMDVRLKGERDGVDWRRHPFCISGLNLARRGRTPHD